MKKMLSFMLALLVCLSLCSCGKPSDEKLADILCSGGWSSLDHTLLNDSIQRETRYISVRFFGIGYCEFVCEDYRNGILTDNSVIKRNWKIEDGKIAIFPDTVDSDSDTVYLVYEDDVLSGSAWYDDSFTYKHISNDEISAIRNSIVPTSAGLEYIHNGDGTCTVAGRGTCTDTDIIIPAFFEDSVVTGIGKLAFAPTDITSIVIPDTVTYIAEAAFLDCKSLTSVTIGKGVTSIGERAFACCTELGMITVPDGVTVIEQGTFNGCSNLIKVTLPASVSNIGKVVFTECNELPAVYFEGTISQWNEVLKDNTWDYASSIHVIHCSDGDID